VHQRKARGYIQREDWGNALAELQRMLGADGENPTLHNQIGDVYLRKDDVPRACEHFERAIDLYSQVGLHNNAVALCKKVMRLRPGRHEMRYRLARLRLEQGFRNEAAVYLREYFEHVTPDPSRIDEFERQCRESIELLDDLAPVGKILEKLEAGHLYNVAFDIVRKEAQRAADAGDEKAAARFTEKMRSLRILVERNGGRDLLAESKPAETGSSAEPGSDSVIGAPPATEPSSLLLPEKAEAAAPRGGSFVDPNRLPGLEPLPHANASGDAVGTTTEAAALHVDPLISAPEDVDVVGSESHADEAVQAAPELPELAGAEEDVGLQLESASARLILPEVDDAGVDDEAESVASDDAAESSVPEFEIQDSSLADLEGELGAGFARGGSAAQTDFAWDLQASSWSAAENAETHAPESDMVADAPVGNAGVEAGAPIEELHAEPRLQSAPPAASWVEALRRTPLWIPPESAPPSATPEGWSSGASMELESVIDSFREQMARALDGDGAARYDLGVAYYEMGLYNEALAEFEAAAHCPGLEVQSYEMLAACLLHTGRHAEVVELLLPVLAAEGHSPRGRLGLQYSLGLAYESLGEREQARRCFEEVALVDIDFKDVQTRLQRIP